MGTEFYQVRRSVPRPGVVAGYIFLMENPSEPAPEDTARAVSSFEYDVRHDRLALNVHGEKTVVRFGVLRTTFEWRGDTYELRLFPLGKLDVRMGRRVVMEGRFEPEAVVLRPLTPDMQPLVTPLSMGLMDRRQFHRPP